MVRVLSSEEQGRIVACLVRLKKSSADTIHLQAEALENLKDFCEGSSSELVIEIVNNTEIIATLVNLLDLLLQSLVNNPCDENLLLHVLKVESILEILLFDSDKNSKAAELFGKTKDGILSLLRLLSSVGLFKPVECALQIAQKASSMLTCLLYHHFEIPDAEFQEAAKSITIFADFMFTYRKEDWSNDLSESVQSLCDLVSLLAAEDVEKQDILAQHGLLEALVRFTQQRFAILNDEDSLRSEQDSIYLDIPFAQSVLLAIRALITANDATQNMVYELGAVDCFIRIANFFFGRDDDVYLAATFLLASLQYENQLMQQAVQELLQTGDYAYLFVGPCADLTAVCTQYFTIADERVNIRENHFDDEVVRVSLQILARTFLQTAEARYFFAHCHGAIEMLIGCLQNIDEYVMQCACLATYNLLYGSLYAQDLFLRRGGLAALSDCLYDYSVKIRKTALLILSILSSEHLFCRDEIRETGTLSHILQIISEFPAEDVNLEVAEAAVCALSHVVTKNASNQDFVRSTNGFVSLARVMRVCSQIVKGEKSIADLENSSSSENVTTTQTAQTAQTTKREKDTDSDCNDDEGEVEEPKRGRRKRDSTSNLRFENLKLQESDLLPMVANTLENVCLALNNLAFRNTDNQNAIRRVGVIDECISIMSRTESLSGLLGRSQLDLIVSMLNLLVNVVDTNTDTQEYLSNDQTANLLSKLILHPSARVASMGCLFMSHLAWNHVANQARFGTESTIVQLLKMIEGLGDDLPPLGFPLPGCNTAAIAGHIHTTVTHARKNSLTNVGNVTSAGEEPSITALVDRPMDGPPSIFPGLAMPSQIGSRGVSVQELNQQSNQITPEMERLELCFYSLLALINLSYQNETVQQIIDSHDGIDVIFKQLGSPVYDTRKTACFCLSNLVKSHKGNAEKLVLAGGVERLVEVLNDEEDDELSKKAFQTLSNMEDRAVCRVVTVIESILDKIPSLAESEVSSLASDNNRRTSKPVKRFVRRPFTSEAVEEDRDVIDVTVLMRLYADLEKYLPVLNGLVYINPLNGQFLLEQFGIQPLLGVLMRRVPLESMVYSLCIIANILSKERHVQLQAVDHGAFDVLLELLVALRPNSSYRRWMVQLMTTVSTQFDTRFSSATSTSPPSPSDVRGNASNSTAQEDEEESETEAHNNNTNNANNSSQPLHDDNLSTSEEVILEGDLAPEMIEEAMSSVYSTIHDLTVDNLATSQRLLQYGELISMAIQDALVHQSDRIGTESAEVLLDLLEHEPLRPPLVDAGVLTVLKRLQERGNLTEVLPAKATQLLREINGGR